MPVRSSAATPIEILAADQTTWLPMVLHRPEPTGPNDPALATIAETLMASESDAPFVQALATRLQETWIRGVGLDYNVAVGVDTRTDGYAFAAGKLTQVQAAAVGVSGPVSAWCEFGADLFYAQEGTTAFAGKVCRSAGGTGGKDVNGTATAGAFAAVLTLALGEYVRDLFVFNHGTTSATKYLYATSSDASGLNGRLHRTQDGVTWTSTGAALFSLTADLVNRYGRNKTKSVHWTRSDGTSGWVIETISGDGMVSYTVPDADPFTGPTSWVEGVPIKTAYRLLRIVGSRGHNYHTANDGVYDLDQGGESPSLVDLTGRVHPANGAAALYHEGYILYSLGNGGLGRVRVDQGSVFQENPGICRPGWQTAARSPWLGGYTTALANVDDYVANAIYNPTTHTSALYLGVPREKVGIESPNPYIWHGPVAVLNADYKITEMHVSALSGDRRLWIGAQSVGGAQAVVLWWSLSDAGSPLDDLQSGGQGRFGSEAGSGLFSPYARLELLPDSLDDKNNLHIVNDVSIGSESLDASTKFVVYQRADPDPDDLTWGTGRDITASPSQTLTPTATLQGHKIQTRIDFVNPSGGGASPTAGFLDSFRMTYWSIVPSFKVLTLDVEYGDGVEMYERGQWEHLGLDPDAVTDGLTNLARSGRTTLRGPRDDTAVIKVMQTLASITTMGTRGDFGKRVRAKVQVIIVGA